MRKLSLSAALSMVLAAGLLSSAGCNSGERQAFWFRRNATPELSHIGRSNGQVKNDHARIIDNNGRMIKDDLDRLLLLDENSRLSPYTSP